MIPSGSEREGEGENISSIIEDARMAIVRM